MNGSLYIYQSNFLRHNTSNRLFDAKCGAIRMIDTAVLDIDDENDFQMMEVLSTYLFAHYLGFKQIKDNISHWM